MRKLSFTHKRTTDRRRREQVLCHLGRFADVAPRLVSVPLRTIDKLDAHGAVLVDTDTVHSRAGRVDFSARSRVLIWPPLLKILFVAVRHRYVMRSNVLHKGRRLVRAVDSEIQRR